jgi:hypothetical protein
VPHHYSLGYALASIAIANVMGLIAMRAGRRHIALQ